MKYYSKWSDASVCTAQPSDSHVLNYQDSQLCAHNRPSLQG